MRGRAPRGRERHMSDENDEEFDRVNQPDEALSLEAFKREIALPALSFARLHGRAFLLLQRAGKTRLQSPMRPGRTLAGRPGSGVSDLPPSRYLVFPIRKTERSLIDRFYSVGQTRNNDVVVRDVSVSKFHAFFQDAEDGGFLLQDARSTNGTFLNGERVPRQGQGEPVRVNTGDRVRFGNVELSFTDADGFRELLQRVFPIGS
jgi:hypothetical protein